MINSISLDLNYPFINNQSIEVIKDTFAKDCYIKLPSFFKDAVLSRLKKEAFQLLEKQSKRKDFKMLETKGTFRHISTVSGNEISKHSSFIPMLYTNEKMIAFLREVAGETIFLTPDLADRHAIHRMHRQGDIHGGHVDDYAFVLILCLEAPDKHQGGGIEFVPYSKELNDLKTNKVRKDFLEVGDAYFMRSNKAVHRVAPLKETVNRTVVVFTYADLETKDIKISYSSASLYD